jgi:predicted DNA-binding protein with PD1-like motif
VIHAHAVVSGPDFVAHAGHLFSAEIAATAEVFLWATGERTERALDERTGLRLISRS